MNIEIINKLDEITNIIKNDKELNKYKTLKDELLNDNSLLSKIERLKHIEKYDNEYINLKKEILDNKNYKEFIELEHKLFFDIKDINIKLNNLIEKSGCN